MQTIIETFLIRSVARATGETASEIGRRGFHSAMPLDVRFDPEPSHAVSRIPCRPVREADPRWDDASVANQDGEIDLVDLAEYGIDWETLLDHSLAESCTPVCARAGGDS